MDPQDIEKTAFVGPDSLYEWLVMPFGLSNAPSEFMRVMSNLLKEHINAGYCVVFIDDVLVYSTDMSQHLYHLERVLHTIQKAGYRLKPEKCSFGDRSAEFLGFTVDGEGVQILLEKVESIYTWPLPQTPKEMRSFVGLAGVYRKFIPHFSMIALPLLDLIPRTNTEYAHKLSNPLIQDSVHKAISLIKKTITSAPVLALPEKGNFEYLIRTDASGFAIGATLRQLQWDAASESFSNERILGYYSRKLSGPETRYSTYDQELLAVRDAIEHWRYYLHGSHFTVQTDHSSLQHVLKQPKLSSRQMRLLERLQEYNFEIEYLPGAQNYIQDALSRRPDYQDTRPLVMRNPTRLITPLAAQGTGSESGKVNKGCCSTSDTGSISGDIFTAMTVNADEWLDEIRGGYTEDPYFAEVLTALESEYTRGNTGSQANKQLKNDFLPPSTPNLERIKARKRHYSLQPDGLITHSKSGTLCIPNVGELRHRIMSEAHDTPIGGHCGIERTASALARRFFWPRMYQEVKQYVRGCASCHRAKPFNQRPYGLLQPLEIPAERWKRINIDFIVKLPKSSSGNDTIITFIDGLTKRAHWIATCERTLTAERFAEIFVDFYFRLHGLPSDIVSDRDVRFTSDWWQHLTKIWQTKLRMSTAFHPQTDGQAEKANSIVERYLRSFVLTRPQERDRLLALAEFSYNAHRHKSTGLAPFEADLGYIPRLPMDIIAGRRPLPQSHPTCLASSFATTMADILYQLRQALQHTQTQQQKESNTKRQPHPFQTGDKVLINTKNLPLSYGNTAPEDGEMQSPGDYSLRRVLQQKYIGEFTLGKQRGPNAFEIADLPANSRISEIFNVDRLRPSYIDHSRKQPPPPPMRVITQAGTAPVVEYEVERILDWRKNKQGVVEFLVKWVGLDEKDDSTWETQAAFTGAKETLSDFILEPQNDELARLLHWPRKISQTKENTHPLRKRTRIKGGPPSRRSSRLLAMRTDASVSDTQT